MASYRPLHIFASLALLSCGGESTGPPVPSDIRLVSGEGQTALVGSALPAPVVVQVVTSGGEALAEVQVRFRVTAGGGTVNPGSAYTDRLGAASVIWALGGRAGEQTLEVTVAGLGPLVVHATGTAGPPAVLAPSAGNGQFAVVGRPVVVRPAVEVTDAYFNPLAGVTVIFRVTSGGGTITDSTPISDASGIAALGSWTLGPTAGLQRLTVTLPSAAAILDLLGFGTPATVLASAGNGQSANAGTLVATPPAVLAVDGDGQPLAGVAIVFAVESGGGTVLDGAQQTGLDGIARAGGWILGLTPGANVMAAQVTGLAPTRFMATGVAAVPAGLAATSPTAFTAFFGNFLDTMPEVRVTDAAGAPVAGASVTFEVTSGDGQVSGSSVASDFEGTAPLGAWRLGPSALDQAVRASVAGVPPLTFTATAEPPPEGQFEIELRFTSTPTDAQRAVFESAVARWRQLILGDLTDIPVTVPASSFGCYPALDETIDDLVIYAEITAIDGPGNVLGSAGPCLIRSESGLTVVGRMRFDEADVEGLGALFREVVVHEMGHVLGFGALWNLLGRLEGGGGFDPIFNGPSARGAFVAAISPDVYLGDIVPVENTGGPGTRDGHWRETVLRNELMTGFLSRQAANPLSAITAASLRDLGYLVNDVPSDPFALASALRAAPSGLIELREAPVPWPILKVDRRGRLK
jgi:hypothetical protein